LILTDFPNANGDTERLCFMEPLEIAVAWSLDDVRATLDRVEQRCADGYFAVGFVAYDAAPAFDAALCVGERAPTPLAWFGIYAAPSPAPLPARATHTLATRDWRPHITRSQYESRVDDIRRGIGEGAFYQVNQTVRLRASWDGDALAAYDTLRAAQPSSYGMYIDTGRFQIASVSPELFFHREGRNILTRPMKGTARRGRWPEEDTESAASLAASDKDRAENVMIVDLVRSDLGRIAESGTVAVPQLFAIERHPTLWQMTSTIMARLRANVRLPDIFDALFPCGSIVGAPKIAAASWIADHEAAPRGIYCGAMGIVRPGGDCIFNVAIRTLVLDSETGIAEYGAGGAITIDSTSAGEYDELLAKAAILQSVAHAFDLLETMRLTDGVVVRRERHVRRLLASANYFDFPDIAQPVDLELDECARLNAVGEYRVRLLVSRDGSARTQTTPVSAFGHSPPLRCIVADLPVDSHDPFLFHKTTRRDVYDVRRLAHPEADEIILVNERRELTECSIGNLVVEIDGERFTPPRSCGLLAGMFREELIERGVLRERTLFPSDLVRATGLWLINSLREWVELRTVRR
jgi:para-aminobenzoate synthetase/4-amino-4-deoxychorismate lyase